MPGQDGRIGLGPEYAVIAVILLHKPHALGIKPAHEPRIYGDTFGVVSANLGAVRGASAGAAMMEFQFAIAPHVDERVWRAQETNLTLRVVGPEAAIEPAVRAIAV